jgi:hypothetical protein
MKLSMSVLALVLCAAPLFAGEAERANADKLLASMTEIKKELLGEQTLKFRMMGIQIGTITFKLEAGEHEGQPCYIASSVANGKLGEVAVKSEATSHLTPSLQLLASESKEWEGDKLTKHSTYVVKNGLVSVKIIDTEHKNTDMQDRAFEIKPEARLLLGAADAVIGLFLSRDAGTKYEFIGWDSDAGKSYELNLEVGEAETLGKFKTVPVVATGKTFEVDELGNVTDDDYTTTTWFDGHTMIKSTVPGGISFDNLDDPKLTRISKDAMIKGESATAVAAGFFFAISRKDKELLGATMNEARFARIALDHEETTKNLPDEQKDQLSEMIKDTIVENILESGNNEDQSETEQKRNEAVIDMLMYEENLEYFELEGRHCARFTGDIDKAMGHILMILEKNADGKWEVVWILNGDDAKEATKKHDENKKKEDKKPEDKTEDEEEGF